MTEQEIFTEAILRTNLTERAAFLDEACGPDAALRRRVEQLLAGHARIHPVLDHQPAHLLAALAPVVPGEVADSPEDQLAPLLGPSPRPGALGRLGHYDVLQVLGQGGFGIVVKAFDDSLQRVVAIKLLSPPLAATSPPRKRFLREARSVAQLKHEHVVQIYAVEEQPVPYLVMEFVDGLTLQEKIDRDGPFDPAEVVRLGCQIARGLAAAHDKGLIHRDVKPANVLLEGGPVESRAKLTDFGLARAADDASQTQSGVFAGSPLYMAPEQVRGEALDARTDLFSLGSMLYTMTAGRPAFRASNTFGVFKRVAEDTPRPLREVISDAPPGLVAVISKLLAKRPDDRYTTSGEAVDALGNCLSGVPSTSKTASRTRSRAAAAAFFILFAATMLWAANRGGYFQSASDEREAFAAAADKGNTLALPVTVGDLLVTSTGDEETSGTLRWAITEANNRHGENVITFNPDVFSRTTTIKLIQGPLVLADSAQTTIIGPATGLTVSGNDTNQVFVIGSSWDPGNPAKALIADITIAHGRSREEFTCGGGVLCQGESFLTVSGCTLLDNVAMHQDGGGGAVYNGNSTVILTNCTLTRNRACDGGAIKNYGGVVKATNCTLVGNSATLATGGIYTLGWGRAQTEVNNSIFANTGGQELYLFDGLEVTGDYNITRDSSAPGVHSKTEAHARLGPLGRNGGPTDTFPLLTHSPALNAGNNDLVPASVKTDQRGLSRIHEGKVDIGAYEAQ